MFYLNSEASDFVAKKSETLKFIWANDKMIYIKVYLHNSKALSSL